MHALARAAGIIRAGGIVAYATEHCFGLGCDPRNRDAVARLLRLKRRAWTKGLILLAADTAQLAPYVSEIPDVVRASWPGPATWLVMPGTKAPRWVTGRHARIAVRVTAHAQASALCRAAGMAIVSTSANRAGQKPARSTREVMRRFGRSVDLVLPGSAGELSAPTPIRDAIGGKMIRT
jgi:L-threonylcarbamoyladenylate synthase